MIRTFLLSFALACSSAPVEAGSAAASKARAAEGTAAAGPLAPGQAQAIFGMGCFWCGESDFEAAPGVIAVESGYAGGPEQHPTYEEVSGHGTGHAEAVRVIYDPNKTSYPELVSYFWRSIDPFQVEGQFCDRGHQYRSVIFVENDEQKSVAEASKKAMQERFGKAIATTIEQPGPFWLAEDYHQDFYKKNPGHYNSYRTGCGRDARTRAVWGDEAHHH